MTATRLPEWEELISTDRPRTTVERLIIQLVMSLATHPQYRSMSPAQVYDFQRERAAAVLLDQKLKHETVTPEDLYEVYQLVPADMRL